MYTYIYPCLFSCRVYQEGGISGLYVGSAARVSWLLPFTTIYLGVYELTKKVLLKRKIDKYVLKQKLLTSSKTSTTIAASKKK